MILFYFNKLEVAKAAEEGQVSRPLGGCRLIFNLILFYFVSFFLILYYFILYYFREQEVAKRAERRRKEMQVEYLIPFLI